MNSFLRAVALVFLSFYLVACASPHVVTLHNGTKITTTGDVSYNSDSGTYSFTNAQGKSMVVNKDDVVSIEGQ